MSKEVYLTKQGYDDLVKELDELKLVKRPAVINSLKDARALGDLSENAEYDAARSEQAIVEGRIAELEVMLDNAKIVAESSDGKVSIGKTVVVKFIDDDEEDEYVIVGSKEADPLTNKISNESPIAKAIIGKTKGSIVDVDSPNGKYSLEILSIR
jgi:transcription elongation factor GreA